MSRDFFQMIIAERHRGNDVNWSLPIADANGAINTSTLADYKVRLFYFVGNTPRTWLTFKKTPTGDELQIYSPTPSSGELKIIIPRAKTELAPLATIYAEVSVAVTDNSGQYADNLKWSTVTDSNTGADHHIICKMTEAAQ